MPRVVLVGDGAPPGERAASPSRTRREKGWWVLGWDSFDEGVVARLERHEPLAVDTSPLNGGMLSPLRGRMERLLWCGPTARTGTAPVGEPPVRFFPNPTFVHEDWRDNILFGTRALESAVAAGHVRLQQARLGHENGESAVTWNAWVGLRAAGLLGTVAAALGAPGSGPEPALFLWGREVTDDGLAPWPELAAVRDVLERDLSPAAQPLPPDVALHVPGFGWLLLEARLTGPTATLAGQPDAVGQWAERYGAAPGAPFLPDTMVPAVASSFPERLLRQVAYAAALTRGGRTGRAVVVSLHREGQGGSCEPWTRRHLRADGPVEFGAATWESLYRLVPRDVPGGGSAGDPAGAAAAALRRWFERKSLGLRPAFPRIAAA